jgi:hypothetical protein
MSKLIWKAEVTDEMVAHLNREEKVKFINFNLAKWLINWVLNTK